MNKYLILILISCRIILLQNQNLFAQQCSQSEVEYLAANADQLADISQSCAFECVLAQDQNACLLSCLAQQIPVSEGCLSCSVNQINCVLDNCAIACLFPNSQACEDCISQNCLPDYFNCIGDNDVDGFTVEGGDCNNNNPQINPSAADFEGDGIDQNCDGEDGIATVITNKINLKFNINKKSNVITVNSDVVGILRIYNISGSIILSTVIMNHELYEFNTGPGLVLYSFSSDTIQQSGKL